MQTFLPYEGFLQSAKILDKQRCWKQVVEAKQIISILSHLDECPNDNVPWMNHPAVQMWQGHIPELMTYFNAFLKISIEKHKINTKYKFFTVQDFKEKRTLISDTEFVAYDPWWLGNKNFHRAMRARLIEKDRDFYLPLFPKDEGFNGGKYLWPLMGGSKTFKII